MIRMILLTTRMADFYILIKMIYEIILLNSLSSPKSLPRGDSSLRIIIHYR